MAISSVDTHPRSQSMCEPNEVSITSTLKDNKDDDMASIAEQLLTIF